MRMAIDHESQEFWIWCTEPCQDWCTEPCQDWCTGPWNIARLVYRAMEHSQTGVPSHVGLVYRAM